MNRRGHFSLTPTTWYGWALAVLLFGPAFLVLQVWPDSLAPFALHVSVIVTVVWLALLATGLFLGGWAVLGQIWTRIREGKI